MSKQKMLVITLIGLVVVLSIMKIYLMITVPPAPSPIPTPTPPTTTEPAPAITPLSQAPHTVAFKYPNIAPPTLPNELPVYATKAPASIDPEQIAARFQFFEPAVIRTSSSLLTYIWDDPNIGTLTFQTPPNYFFLTRYQTPPPPPAIDPALADNILFQTLKEQGVFDPNLPPAFPQRTYFRGNDFNMISEKDASSANLLQTDYAYNLNNYPLYMSTSPLFSTNAVVMSNGQILSMAVFVPPLIESPFNAPLLTVTEAADRLSSNQGFLVSAIPNISTEITVEPNFSLAQIKSVDLIYVYDENAHLATPTYRFIGTAPHQDKSRIIFDVTYLVSAVK